MTVNNEALWCQAVEDENWVEAARLEEIARSAGKTSMEAAQILPADPHNATFSEGSS